MGWKKVWEPWMDAVMRERYADAKNEYLVRELGVSMRTVERHARELGLEKSAEHMEKTQMGAAMAGARELEYRRLVGRAVKKRVGGRPFTKGHRWDAETEKKRVEALRETAWQERRRVMHGMRQKTRWKIVVNLKEKL